MVLRDFSGEYKIVDWSWWRWWKRHWREFHPKNHLPTLQRILKLLWLFHHHGYKSHRWKLRILIRQLPMVLKRVQQKVQEQEGQRLQWKGKCFINFMALTELGRKLKLTGKFTSKVKRCFDGCFFECFFILAISKYNLYCLIHGGPNNSKNSFTFLTLVWASWLEVSIVLCNIWQTLPSDVLANQAWSNLGLYFQDHHPFCFTKQKRRLQTVRKCT